MVLNKSTNVRADSVDVADRVAELFLTPPPRRPSSSAERDLLATAVRTELEFEGERMPVYRFGHTGPIALLVHGWGGSSAQLVGFVEPLLARGGSVVAFDAPGHGDATGTWLAIPRFARAIQRVAESVGPVRAIIGHSMGAAASVFAVSMGLRLDRAVLIGPPASEYEFFRQWFATLGLPDQILPLAKQRVVDRVGVTFERLGPQPLTAGVMTPLLVIHDRDDREVPYTDGLAIANAARNGQLHTTEGLGHRRILRDPSVVLTTVNFVNDPRLSKDTSSNSASNLALL
jgi:pimeloyl-ACP methyl ester carboxylesterase